MKRFLIALIAFFSISACGPAKPSLKERLDAAVDSTLAAMTTQEKVWQLFTVGTHELQDSLYPVGGVILFAYDVKDSAQLVHLTDSLHALPGKPLVSIDEEGGRVARIGRNKAFNVPRIPPMGEASSPEDAYSYGNEIGRYLSLYGIDIDFAPVADVNTNPQNPVIGDRAFSDDPSDAAGKVVKYLQGLSDAGIYGCIKHFPGHGDTKTDSHYGYAQSLKTWEELLSCEMIPFKAGIEAGTPLVMTAHIAVPSVTGSEVPSTLSPLMLTEKLRGELGYEGLIITDALRMGAISKEYSCREAAALAFIAGADILLLPENPLEAFQGVMAALQDGSISEDRLNQSVRRILELKLQKTLRLSY